MNISMSYTRVVLPEQGDNTQRRPRSKGGRQRVQPQKQRGACTRHKTTSQDQASKSKANTIGMRQKATSHYYFRCKGPITIIYISITKTVITRLVPRIKLVKTLHERVVGFQRRCDGLYSKFDGEVIKQCILIHYDYIYA